MDGEGEEGVKKGKLRSLAGADAAAQDGSGNLQRASGGRWAATRGGVHGRGSVTRARLSPDGHPSSSSLLLRSSITAHDQSLDIRPNVALVAPLQPPFSAMSSNDAQKADQIAHRCYSKLALVVNHARATIESSPDAKLDKWVRSSSSTLRQCVPSSPPRPAVQSRDPRP